MCIMNETTWDTPAADIKCTGAGRVGTQIRSAKQRSFSRLPYDFQRKFFNSYNNNTMSSLLFTISIVIGTDEAIVFFFHDDDTHNTNTNVLFQLASNSK